MSFFQRSPRARLVDQQTQVTSIDVGHKMGVSRNNYTKNMDGGLNKGIVREKVHLRDFNSPEPTPPKKKSVRRLFSDFAEQTTLHGASKVVSPDKPAASRVFWAVIIVAGAGWAMYNVLQVGLLFMSSPVSSVVSVQYRSSLPFPAVTLCNLNPFRGPLFFTHPGFAPLRATMDEEERKGQQQNLDPETVGKSISEAMKDFIAKMSRQLLREVGHQLEDMLIECSMGGDTCGPDNFTTHFDIHYGLCYIFNRDQTWGDTRMAGPSVGLRLLLTIEEPKYIHLTTELGMRVLVHQPRDTPFPEDQGVLVGPGFLTEVGFTKKVYQRHPAPYGECLNYDQAENSKVNMFSKAGMQYSAAACQKTCYAVQAAVACGCCDPDYACELDDLDPLTFIPGYSGKNLTGLLECDLKDNASYVCVKESQLNFQRNQGHCAKVCLPPCFEEVFTPQVSVARWPSQMSERTHIDTLNRTFGERNYRPQDQPVDANYLRFSIVKLNVFFTSTNYEQIKTDPAYDWARVLGDVGGQMGLWLGSSLLTFLELCELILLTARHLLYTFFSRGGGGGNTPVKVFP